VTFDPVADQPDAALASAIVWFDAYVTNVDRTPRNTNLLVWHRRLWLIDHGAALYFHHTWDDYLERSRTAFPLIKDHVLLPYASALREADAQLTGRLTGDILAGIVQRIPEAWLGGDAPFESDDQHRAAYLAYLLRRLEPPHTFLEEAIRARSRAV
jgi:hypothetical protein